MKYVGNFLKKDEDFNNAVETRVYKIDDSVYLVLSNHMVNNNCDYAYFDEYINFNKLENIVLNRINSEYNGELKDIYNLIKSYEEREKIETLLSGKTITTKINEVRL